MAGGDHANQGHAHEQRLEARLRDLEPRHRRTAGEHGGEDRARVGARQELELEPAQAASIGDDLPDLALFERCVLAFAVPEAPDLVRAHAHYVTRRPGGRGAVREACELILEAQDQLRTQLASYLT